MNLFLFKFVVAKNDQPHLSSLTAETFFATSQILKNLLNGNVLLHSTKRKEKEKTQHINETKRGTARKRLKEAYRVVQICYQIYSFLQHSLQYLGLVTHDRPLPLPLSISHTQLCLTKTNI